MHAYENESTLPSRESCTFLPVRKPSITRVSSCPPSIQAGSDNNKEGAEVTGQKQEERYIPCPRPSAEVKVPLLNQQELQVFGTGIEDNETVSSEEAGESDGSSNEDSSTDDGGAEAMAMRSLAKHLENASIHQTSVDSLPPETQPDLLSVCSDDDFGDHDGEGIEQVSESGSSAYITLESIPSTQSSPQVHHTEVKPEKSRAGSYVSLSTLTKERMPQHQAKDSNILPKSLGARSTVDSRFVPVQSMQPPVSNAAVKRCNATNGSGLKAENQTARNPEVSPYQNQPEKKETSQLKSEGFASVSCKSADELLGSLSKDSMQQGLLSFSLTDLLSVDLSCGSFEEAPSPLITDLQEESEDDNGDCPAELSLGKFSLQESNVDLELNKLEEEPSFSLEEERTDMELDNAKESTNNVTNTLHEFDRQEDSTLSEESQSTSNVGLELSNFSDQSPVAPEGEHAKYKIQPPADKEMASASVSGDYISNRELLQHSLEENSSFSEESQGVDSPPCFNRYQFLAVKESANRTDATDQWFHSMPELIGNEDWGEESDPDNEDVDETSDTEFGSSCGSLGHSPDKIKVLNCGQLVFDQGQEELEMKKFSLNNLSKTNLKSTEFPVFKEDHFLGQETSSLCSNQLDDEHNEDGCSLIGDHEAEFGVQGNIWIDPALKGKSNSSDL